MIDKSLLTCAELVCKEYHAQVKPAWEPGHSVYIVRIGGSVDVLDLNKCSTEEGIREMLNQLVSKEEEEHYE